MHIRKFALVGLSLTGLATGSCTGKPQEAPVRSVATPTPSPTPYRASPSAAPAETPYRASAGTGGGSVAAPSQASAGSIQWYSSISEAQAAARAQGKLILVGSTKDGCGLCEKFAHTTAPQCWERLSQVAVPYMYDIQKYDTRMADNVRVDRTLRANLRGAALMPLVGFFTPDLQWVSGFSGPRTVSEFMGDIESARRIYPVHAPSLPPPGPVASSSRPALNEFVETEWSAPADWPAPEDALGPVANVVAPAPAPQDPAVAAPAPAPEPVPTPAEPVAVATPEPTPALAPEPAREVAPTADPAAGWSTPATTPAPTGTAIVASPEPFVPPPSAPVAPAEPVAPPVAATGSMSDADAHSALQGAFALIREGKFDEARTELRRVSKAMSNTAAGREADKGGVALYNARRIASADADQRGTLSERARRDLAGSMWAGLFT